MFRIPKFTASPIVPAVLAVGVFAIAACGDQAAQEDAAPANPLAGVWSMTAITADDGSMIEPSQSGLFIFTESHYSAVYSLGADPRPQAATAFAPTSDEMVAQYQTIIVNTGTYDVSGSTITFRPMVAKSAEFVGGSATMDFAIDGNTLTLNSTSVISADGMSPPAEVSQTIRLRRIE